MINMTKPGIGSEKTETIPVKAKRTPNIQLSIKPTEIFLLGVVCSLIVLKLVNKKCQNFPYFYFFTKENFVQRGADDPTWLDPTIVGDRHVGYPLLCDVARATRRTAEVSAPRYLSRRLKGGEPARRGAECNEASSKNIFRSH